MKKSDKNKVYEIYDKIIHWFDAHRSKDLSLEKAYLDVIQAHIPASGSVLDVGCGTGEPIAKFFIEQGYQVTGVDASKAMIELCKQRFPQAHWLLADMRTLQLPGQFDIVLAWHSFFHLPHEDQKPTLQLLTSYVKSGGLFAFTSGTEHSEVWSDNGGYDLYHASLDPEEYIKILEEYNFKLIMHKMNDPDCGGATTWLVKKN